jgi:hypothetical protein
MSNKLILSESQYNRLKDILSELSVRDAKKAAKKTLATSNNPDEIKKAKEKLNSFSKKPQTSTELAPNDNVSDERMGEFIQFIKTLNPNENIDLIFNNGKVSLNFESIDGDKAKFKVDKTKINAFPPLFKNMKDNIEIVLTKQGLVSLKHLKNWEKVSGADNDNKKQPESDDLKNKLSDTLLSLMKINEGKSLNFTMSDGNDIRFCCLSKSADNSFSFELIEDDKSANKYKKFKGFTTFTISIKEDAYNEDFDLYEANKTIITSRDDGATFSLMFTGHNATGEKKIPIEGISHFEFGDDCKHTDDGKGRPKGKEEFSKEEIKAMYQEILDDPKMKNAFLRKDGPGRQIWNLIVSSIKGTNPKSIGIGPAKRLLNQYGSEKIKQDLGPSGSNFVNGKRAQFYLLNNIKNTESNLNLDKDVLYEALVNPYKRGDDKLTLTSNRLGVDIVVNKAIGNNTDTFEVTITKFVKTTKGPITKYKPINGVIKFVNKRGTGYSKEKNTN